ncbi:aminodeoxychorismate lyase [Superficieibacter electus]|uniref:Aminodeoxychorismate lyase n=1 Tax=Superficieibacter electus TaxID=2022662 RepID=A0A2P5GJM2_9ENTR|nr:aminodeoxychorismate lyase [Superficieibacter electus]POP41884.1 aminodeoxychorismate lyase [Superficieibacter electus]POP44191.1 aminodeoxychorismate lyase [Superficieibacter electus]
MFLINGCQQNTLAAADRATQFGDGCFTTARIATGRIALLEAHVQRLRAACERLHIPFESWDILTTEMQQLAAAKGEGVLKVVLSRGGGGRGYSPTACLTPTRMLSVSDYPAHFSRWRSEGITLTLSPVRLGRNPHLAGIKHLNRLEQVLIRMHLEQTNADEALVLDSDGWLTECCAANIFWRQRQTVFTPQLENAGVAGIMRQHCLNHLSASPWRVREVQCQEIALAGADEVIICNALMPLVPVRRWNEHVWSSRELYHFLAPLCEP